MSNIFFKSRVVYFLLALAAIATGAFAIVTKIESLSLEASTSGVGASFDKRSLSLAFFGDAMFDRAVRVLMQENGYDHPFMNMKDFVKAHDVSILNLEGVYTDNPSVSAEDINVLRFTFDPKGIPSLKEAGFDVVSQANNHANDYGRDGLSDSKIYLSTSGVPAFGDFFNEGEPFYFEKKGQKISLIGFNEFSGQNEGNIEKQIVEASERGYFVIVFPHWGEEYERFPNASQKLLAHQWIDLGADAIIGSHPHVIETIEEYNGKPVFYSLGNFIFDQYFSEQTQTGIAVSLFIGKREAGFLVTPLGISRSVPELLSEEKKSAVLEQLVQDSNITLEWKENIQKGVETKFPR